ncbi:MFS transporter [Microlunatus parietis]|uniref:MFS family permease n=1 Tax=Microlunatus parietis TaxID=682979 RepID=A0A7Y9I374_9ACTN|nr:MFS transporter [Microlunatus parietis]NYE69382.1 MFS family permease [Microlunatus parietis]
MTTTSTANLAPVIRKVTARLIPILLLMYILAFLDRSNLGFAKAAFQADTGLSNAAYALGAGIFFLGYAVLEVPSNLLMRRVGAKAWLARIMISWGIVSALMMFATNEPTFYLLRVLLGITEAGFFPGVIYYLTQWIPVEHRARVNGLFYFGAPLAFIFGGPLSGLLLDLDGLGGLHGWQLMFLITGLLTVVVGIVVISYLPNGPKDARWLSEAERATLLAAMDSEDDAKQDHSPRGALRALANPGVLYFSAIYLTIQMAVYGVTFYLPTQVAGVVGQEVGLQVGLLTGAVWTLAIVGVVVATRIADRTGHRRVVAAVALGLAALGILLSVVLAQPVLVLLSLAVGAAGFIAVQPVFWTLPTSFLVGAAAASGIALINSVGSLGGFLAPIVKNWADGAWGPKGGSITLAIIAAVGAVLIAVSHVVSAGVRTIAERRENVEEHS